MSRSTDIADAIVVGLNAQSWTTFPTASFVRRWGIFKDLEDAAVPTCSVIPRSITRAVDQSARRVDARVYGFAIVAQRKIESYDANGYPKNSGVDPMATFMEEVFQYLDPTDSADAPVFSSADHQNTEHEDGEIIESEDLTERRLATAIITTTYVDYV